MQHKYRYRVYCNTESAFVVEWSETTPTECPNNAGHSIDSNNIVIVDKLDVFGSEYNYAVSDEESSTTSTSWQEKLDLSINDLPEGEYRLEWSFEWSFSHSECCNANFGVHINWGAIVLSETELSVPTGGTYEDGGFYHQGGFGYVTLTEGNHKVAINFYAGIAERTAYIRRARLELWRES